MKKTIIPIIFITSVFIILILVFFGPWYTLSIDYNIIGIKANYNQIIYLDSIDLSGKAGGFDFTQTIPIETMDAEGISNSYIEFIQAIKYLIVISIISSLIGLIGIFGVNFNSDKKQFFKKLGVIFCIITFCLTIFTVIYFIVGWNSLENMIQQNIDNFFDKIGIQNPFNTNLGFWDTRIKSNSSFSMGPGYAWYLLIIAGVFSWMQSFFINRYQIGKSNIKD